MIGTIRRIDPAARLGRDQSSSVFDANLPPCASVPSGSLVEFETHDARAGALLPNPLGESFLLEPPIGPSNPVTGPLAVAGAEPGATLVVEIIGIELASRGWCGSHAYVGGFRPGTIPEPLARVCDVGGGIQFRNDLVIPISPMIGCIGTAPAGESQSTQSAGRHGGNMDHPALGVGALLHLPVFVPGGLLFVGDVHAIQGDGELSGLGLEIPAVVRARVQVQPDRQINWPWIKTMERVMVCTAASTFEEARHEAVEAMLRALTEQLSLRPAEAMALISLIGDLRVGSAWGAPEITLRLEVPSSLGINPQR